MADREADLQRIRELWYANISNTVVVTELNKVLLGLIEQGVSSEYMVFVMEYVVANHCNLNYPPGFRYFVDKPEIKAKYAEKSRVKIPKDAFIIRDVESAEKPIGIARPREPCGFGGILRGRS